MSWLVGLVLLVAVPFGWLFLWSLCVAASRADREADAAHERTRYR